MTQIIPKIKMGSPSDYAKWRKESVSKESLLSNEKELDDSLDCYGKKLFGNPAKKKLKKLFGEGVFVEIPEED